MSLDIFADLDDLEAEFGAKPKPAKEAAVPPEPVVPAVEDKPNAAVSMPEANPASIWMEFKEPAVPAPEPVVETSPAAPEAAPLTPEQEEQRYAEFVRQTMPEADPEMALIEFRKMSPENRRALLEGFGEPAVESAPASPLVETTDAVPPAAPKTRVDILAETIDAIMNLPPPWVLSKTRNSGALKQEYIVSKEGDSKTIATLRTSVEAPAKVIIFIGRDTDILPWRTVNRQDLQASLEELERTPAMAVPRSTAPGTTTPQSTPSAPPAAPLSTDQIYNELCSQIENFTPPADFRIEINSSMTQPAGDDAYFNVYFKNDIIGVLHVEKKRPGVIGPHTVEKDIHSGAAILNPILGCMLSTLSDALIELKDIAVPATPPPAPPTTTPAALTSTDERMQKTFEATVAAAANFAAEDFTVRPLPPQVGFEDSRKDFYVEQNGINIIGILRVDLRNPDQIEILDASGLANRVGSVTMPHTELLLLMIKNLATPPVAPPESPVEAALAAPTLVTPPAGLPASAPAAATTPPAAPPAPTPAAPPSNPAAPTAVPSSAPRASIPTVIELTRNMFLRNPVTASLFAGAMAIAIISGIYAVNSSPSDSQKPPKKTDKISDDTKAQVLNCIFTIQKAGPVLDHCTDEKGSRAKGAKITDHKCTDGPDKNDRPDKCEITITKERRKGTATAKMTQPGQRFGAKLPFRVTVRGK